MKKETDKLQEYSLSFFLCRGNEEGNW